MNLVYRLSNEYFWEHLTTMKYTTCSNPPPLDPRDIARNLAFYEDLKSFVVIHATARYFQR